MLGLLVGDFMDFIFIKGLSELEHNGDYDGAIRYLYSLWKHSVNDLGIMRRLIGECWIVLCELYRYKLNKFIAKDVLIEVTEYALKMYPKDIVLNWQIGYMMSLFPDFFIKFDVSDKYLEFEKKGIEMLRFAYMSEPNNLVFKKSYLGSFISSLKSEEYAEVCEDIKGFIKGLFNGDTEIERYFKEVLQNNFVK